MSDSYQAIYDAVRSRLGNISETIRVEFQNVAWQQLDISFMKASLQADFYAATYEMARPCVVFKPIIQSDGDMWTVLLGPNPQIGVFATGATPAEAMANFDQEFWKGKPPETVRQERIDNGQFGVGA